MSDSALNRFERLEAQPLVSVTSSHAWFGGFWGSIKAIFAHRQLLGLLIRRDIKSRYKDSVLGLLWTLINPIVQLLVYWAVMGQILGAARGIEDFGLYIFAGLTIFGLFSEALSGATNSIVANSGLVKKVYVPREVFPLATLGSSMFTFAVQLVVLFGACIVLGSPPFTPALVWFIPSVILIVIYVAALGMFMSALNVYLRDVQYLTQIFLMLSLWASPIVYGWTMVLDVFERFHLPAWLLEVYTNNPVTLAVLGFHKAFWVVGPPDQYPPELGLRMLVACLAGLVLLWLGQRVFARLQGNFAQEL